MNDNMNRKTHGHSAPHIHWKTIRGQVSRTFGKILRCVPVLLFVIQLVNLSENEVAGQDRPNIVLIMADDMGYSDIGCYGGEIQTPTLDKLAEDGLRFTQFYNNARCCPTRASLMTGLYPHQSGVGWMMADNGHEGYRGDLNRRCVTIAEVLRTAGYSTYMSGKWHVARHVSAEGPKHNWPLQRGFDRFYGTIHGAGSFYDPKSLTRGNTQIAPDEENYYYTDAISNNAIKYIDEHESDEPFFLYVAYTAPHWPMHALPEDIERYRGRYDTGWDALRAERYQRMIRMGLIEPSWEMAPRDNGIPAWQEASLKAWHRNRMEVYAAMVDRMDLGIGRIVSKLKETERFENTVILFLADNGGCAEESGSTGPLQPDDETRSLRMPMDPDELQTEMIPKFTRDGLPIRMGEGVFPGPADTHIAYGKPWANASNTPFRMYKHWVHEGGIATPLIAHWPAGIARSGELEHQPGHVIDIMATCVDLADAEYPTEFSDEPIHPVEGLSLVPAFQGEQIDREAIYWEHEGNRAIRVDSWKLVAKGVNGKWELYDLASDRTELNDLSAEFPEKAQELADRWEEFAQRAYVYPLTPYRNNNTTFNRSQKRFELESGASLTRERAPFVTARTFSISISFEGDDKDGVLIAQGGSSAGYTVFLRDGRLVFATRHQGEISQVSGDVPLNEEPHEAMLELSADGSVIIKLDGEVYAEGKVKGPLNTMPLDGLEVNRDEKGAVGPYSVPNRFDGDVKVVIELED